LLQNPLSMAKLLRKKIIPIDPKLLNTSLKRNEEINFSFKSLKTSSTKDIFLLEIKGINQKPYKIYDLKNENGIITFKYKFKRIRFYDVHLKIDNSIVATATINVTKT
jgi:hypothetical protein